MKNKLYYLLAASLILTTSTFAQDLAKDSVKVQKIIKEASKGNAGVNLLTITDKEKVAFLSSYIDAKKKEEETAEQKRMTEYENVPGRKYRKGDKSAKPQVLAILKGKDKDKILALINDMDPDYTEKDKAINLDADVKTELFTLVSDTTVERNVVQFLGYNKVEGYIPVFENRLLSGKSIDNGRLFYWLGSDGKSEKAVDYFISSFGNKTAYSEDNDMYWFTEGLSEFLEKGTEPIKKKIIDFAIAFTEKNPITIKDLMKQEKEEEDIVGGYISDFDPKTYFIQLVLTSDDPRVPAFSEKQEAFLAKFILPKDRKELHDAMLPNLLRFYDFPKKKEAVLQSEPAKDDFIDLMNAVSEDKALLNDKEVAPHLFSLLEKCNYTESYQADIFISSLKEMDKPVFEAALTAIKSTELRKVVSEKYLLENKGLAENNDYLVKNGLIASPVTQESIKEHYKEDGIELDDYSIYTILQTAGISLSFDVEVGDYPARHDVLLLDFEKKSMGKIAGIKAYQQSRINKKTDTSDIHLITVYNNKAYIVIPEDMGDWYDIDTFGSLLQTIQEDSNMKERFVSVNTGDQTAWYIFGKPEKVQSLIDDYKLSYEFEEAD
jgi:hypothetical protein